MSEGDSNINQRPDGRAVDQLRTVTFKNNIAPHATGSTLIEWGNTRVICCATVDELVPRGMKLQNVEGGWITAEYSMLPRATNTRTSRERDSGHVSGRSQEIQRLIGRSLRAVPDLEALGERTVQIDCDVIQADGGTRTAAITGAYVALFQALDMLVKQRILPQSPLVCPVAAISVGILGGNLLLDLCYDEDFAAEVDFNVVLTADGGLVELQGATEARPFQRQQVAEVIALAYRGLEPIFRVQQEAIGSL